MPDEKPGRLAESFGLLGLIVPNEGFALRTAEYIAQRSSCVRGQIGAIALDRMNAVIGVGWNVETNGEDCGTHCPRARSSVPSLSSYTEGPGRCISTHAEVMALRDAGFPLIGSGVVSRVVVSYTPCPDCMEMLKSIDGLSVIAGTKRKVR